MKCIKFGKFNFVDIFLLGGFISDVLLEYLLGIDEGFGLPLSSFIPFDKVINTHCILLAFITCFGMIILGLVFYFCFKFEISTEKEMQQLRKGLNISDKNNPMLDKRYNFLGKQTGNIILLGLLYMVYTIGFRILESKGLENLDFWFFEILYIYLLYKKINPQQTRHQILYVKLNFFIIFPLYLLYTFFPIDNEDLNGSTVYNIYQYVSETWHWAYNILFIVIYQILNLTEAYSYVKIKFMLNTRFENPYKIIIIFGIVGIIFCIILEIIFSFIEVDFFYQIDNFKRYIEEMTYLYNNNKTNFYLEIFLVYPLIIVFSFLSIFCRILYLREKSPYYIILNDNLDYTIYTIVTFSLIVGLNINFIYKIAPLLNLIIRVFGVFLTAIVLELIILPCCGLDIDIKDNIIKRNDLDFLIANEESKTSGLTNTTTSIELKLTEPDEEF